MPKTVIEFDVAALLSRAFQRAYLNADAADGVGIRYTEPETDRKN